VAEVASPAQAADASRTAAAPTPYGITPYVARAVARIQEHLRDASADPLRKGEAFVVGVFGEWGSGKSTVLDAIGAAFDNKPTASAADSSSLTGRADVTLKVEFNAWRFEREEHLLIPLLKTIQRTLDAYIEALRQREADEASVVETAARAVGTAARKAADPRAWKWLLGRAQLLGACTIALTRMVKLKAGIPGLGEVELNPAEALKAAQEQIDRAAKLTAKTPPERPLESLYYDLYAHLRKLTRGLDEQDRNKLNFVFLIDDLDRCLPEKAVEMLEAIKLFLDVEGCAFVLALDDEVIERGIAHRYRDYLQPVSRFGRDAEREFAQGQQGDRFSELGAPPITGHEYLEKIVQLPFRLPRWSKREVREFLPARYRDFFARWSGAPMDPLVTSGAPATPDPWLLDLIVEAVPPMPRNLVRAIELLEFTRAVAIDRKLGDKLQAYPLAQLVLLQLFAPQCFRFLRRGHAEGWKTFERRLRRDHSEFSGSDAQIMETLGRQPAVLSEQFFDWWDELCRMRLAQTADPYVGRTEQPLIHQLRLARRNRGGFDPRDLFLLARESVQVDDVLEPYFSLFADGVTRTSTVGGRSGVGGLGSPAPAQAPGAAARPAPPPPQMQAQAPPAPGPAPVETPGQTAAMTAAPRDRDEFLRQLLSSSPDAWRNAISREDALIDRTLDEKTVDELLARLKVAHAPARDVAWLETVAPLLSGTQLRRLLRETDMLRQWAAAAGVLPPQGSTRAGGVPS
jgi:hypothetical protein